MLQNLFRKREQLDNSFQWIHRGFPGYLARIRPQLTVKETIPGEMPGIVFPNGLLWV